MRLCTWHARALTTFRWQQEKLLPLTGLWEEQEEINKLLSLWEQCGLQKQVRASNGEACSLTFNFTSKRLPGWHGAKMCTFCLLFERRQNWTRCCSWSERNAQLVQINSDIFGGTNISRLTFGAGQLLEWSKSCKLILQFSVLINVWLRRHLWPQQKNREELADWY